MSKVLSKAAVLCVKHFHFLKRSFFITTMTSRPAFQSGVKSIGTHDGNFHCDEVLACFMLKQLPEFADAQIIRTRDDEVLKTCDIVVDVGGVFNPDTLRFDHHQKSFNESMSSLIPGKPWITRLSSAGLVYSHYGKEVLAQILDKKKDDEMVELLYDKVYENFIEEIDAVDNGISLNAHPMKITTTISRRVSHLNPTWRDPKPDEWQCFQKALTLVGNEFLDRVHHYASDWFESFSIVKAAIDSRYEVDPSGEIIELPNGGCPWKDHLANIEKDLEIEVPIKYAIFTDGKGMWRIMSVPITPDSFILRTPLLEEWRGLRGKELEDVSNIPTINFVHSTGFIGGAAERQSVIQMARISLGKAT